MFCLNVGRLDRALRVLLGLSLMAIAAGLAWPSAEWRPLAWFGLIPLVTGLIGYCPVYTVAEISTVRGKG